MAIKKPQAYLEMILTDSLPLCPLLLNRFNRVQWPKLRYSKYMGNEKILERQVNSCPHSLGRLDWSERGCHCVVKSVIYVCLFVLRINIPVNNFSVMLGRSQRFLGLISTVGS